MSVETAKAFLTKFTAEPTIRTQLYIMSPKTISDFIHYAHSKTGYTFSKEDLSTALVRAITCTAPTKSNSVIRSKPDE